MPYAAGRCIRLLLLTYSFAYCVYDSEFVSGRKRCFIIILLLDIVYSCFYTIIGTIVTKSGVLFKTNFQMFVKIKHGIDTIGIVKYNKFQRVYVSYYNIIPLQLMTGYNTR